MDPNQPESDATAEARLSKPGELQVPFPSGVNPIDDEALLLEPTSASIPASRFKRAIQAYAMMVLQTLVTLASGFFVTPILLRLLGDPRVGAQKAAGDSLGYLALFDLGLSGAFSVLILRARNTGSNEVQPLVSYAFRILAVVASAALIVGVGLAWLMPYIVNVPASLQSELRWASLILLLPIILGPYNIYRSVLETAQLGYLVSAGLLVQSIAIIFLSLLFAYLGYGLQGQVAAVVIGAIIWTLLLRHWGVGELNRASQAVRSMSSSVVIKFKEVWQVAWPLAITTAGFRLNLMTDTIVIGYLLDSKRVVAFFLTQRLIFTAAGQINVVSNASWAGLVQMVQTGHLEQFSVRMIELSRLIIGSGIVITGTVAAFNSQVIHLWIGSARYGGDLLCILSVVQSILFGFLLLYSWVLDALGDARRRLPVSTTGSILNLGLSILFVKMIGIAGVTLGTVCGYILTDVWFGPYLIRRRYCLHGRQLALSAARAVAIGLPWAILMWLLARWYVPPYRWVGLICEGVCVGVCAIAYCWLFILTNSDRAAWRLRIRVSR